MPAPTISEPPELPTFPAGRGLPDQPGVFIPKVLAFLAWFTTFRAYLVELAAYFESLSGSGGGSSSGSLRWNVSTSAADAYTIDSGDTGAHVRFTNDSGVELILPVDGSHGFSTGDRVKITQDGAGEVGIVPATGVMVNSIDGLVSRGQGAVFEIEYVGSNEWDAHGNLTNYVLAPSGDMTDGDDVLLSAGDMTDGDDQFLASGV